MTAFPHSFEGPIVWHDVGSARYRYRVVWLPDDLATALPLSEHPRLRISGEINDHPIEAALTPLRGRWYILLSQKVLRAVDAAMDDVVSVRFGVADQDAVEIPDELADALENDPSLQALWAASTAGRKRGLAYRVASAKTQTTRLKRTSEVVEILRGERDERGRRKS